MFFTTMPSKKEFVERVLDSFFVYFNKEGQHFIEPLRYDSSKGKLIRFQREKSKIHRDAQTELKNPDLARIISTDVNLLNNVHEPNWSDPVLYATPSVDESHMNYMSLSRAGLQLRAQVQTPIIRLKDLVSLVKIHSEQENLVLPLSQIEYGRRIPSVDQQKYCDFLCSRLPLEKEKIENRSSFSGLSIQEVNGHSEEPRKPSKIPEELEKKIKDLSLL